MDWVIARTNVWDAIGLGSYGLLLAFLESLILFGVVFVVGLFTPRRWEIDRRIAFLSLLVIITALWAILGQASFIWNIYLPSALRQFVTRSEHPFRLLYGMYLAFVIPTVLLPVYFFIRSNRSVKWMQELVERLSTLTLFYLFFDAAGLIIVILRNLS